MKLYPSVRIEIQRSTDEITYDVSMANNHIMNIPIYCQSEDF